MYDVMLPVFVICKIFGLAPFKLHSEGKQTTISAQAKYFALLHMSLVISLICYSAYLLASTELKSNINTTVIKFDACIRMLLTTFILASVLINQNILMSTVRHLIQADHLITETGLGISYTNARKFSVCLVTSVTSLYVLQLAIQLLNFEDVLNTMYCTLIVVDYIDSIFILQYTGILLLLCQRYYCLNKGITSLRTQILLEQTKHIFHIYPKEFSTAKQTSLLTGHNNKPVKWSMLQVLQSLGKIHNKLFDVSTHINRAYSPVLLLSVGTSFGMMISQLLATYYMVLHSKLTAVSYLMVGIQLVLNSAKIFLISSVSSNTAKEVNSIG